MASTRVSNDVWYRCVPTDWKTTDGFRTDIRPSILGDDQVQRALFIVGPESKDEFGVFIPMDDIRRAIGSELPGRNGSVAFSVILSSSTINGRKVSIRKVIPD
jgi:hypothetical protein